MPSKNGVHISQHSVRRMVRQLHQHIAEQRETVMECRNRAGALTAAGVAFHSKSSASAGGQSPVGNVCFVEVASEKDVKNNFVPNGTLSGVAIAVSDALDVQEFRTRSGLDTPMFHHTARKEFPLISWLRRQGAQFVGKLSCRTPLAINEGCIFGKEKPASIAVAQRCCHYCISCSLNGPASVACAVAHDIVGFKPTAQTFGTFTEQFKLSMPSMTLGIAASRVDDLLYLWQVYTAAIDPTEYFEKESSEYEEGLYPKPKQQQAKYARPEMIDHNPSNYTIKDRQGQISDIDVGWRDYNAETASANDFGNTPRPGFFDRVVRGKKAKYDTPQVELTVGYPAEWIDKYCTKMYGSSKDFHKRITDTAFYRSALHKNQRLELVSLSFDFEIEDIIHAVNVISHYELAKAFENLFIGYEKDGGEKEGGQGEPGSNKDLGVTETMESSDTERPAALNRPNTFQAMSGVLEELPKEIVASIYKGQTLRLSDYHTALRLRDDVVRATEDQFHDVDSIVVPLLAEPYTPGNMQSVGLTLPFHLAGNPILSVQVDKDMPVALIGELGRDAALLEDSFCFLQFVRGASPNWWREKIQRHKTL